MDRGITGPDPGDTATRAAEIMIDKDIHAVVVLDGEKAVGVVSQTDLVLARQGLPLHDTRAIPVRDIMTPQRVTLTSACP